MSAFGRSFIGRLVMQLWSDPCPNDPCGQVLLLHGAGAAADTPWMNAVAFTLAQAHWWVWRAEFDYMAQRRAGYPKRPPPKMTTLIDELDSVLRAHIVARGLPVLLVGKSMGGRVATLWLAHTQQSIPATVLGALVLGYPFHPARRPDRPRIDHFGDLRRPVEIIQGERDPMGSKQWVMAQKLPLNPAMFWQPGGNHDLKVSQRSSGVHRLSELLLTRAQHWADQARAL